jgi:hypothetical protein
MAVTVLPDGKWFDRACFRRSNLDAPFPGLYRIHEGKIRFFRKISGFAAVLGLFLTVFGMVESAGKSSFLVG